MSKCLFLWVECALPESAARVNDYNVKKVKTFNKVMEIQVLWEKCYVFWMLMNKGQAKSFSVSLS